MMAHHRSKGSGNPRLRKLTENPFASDDDCRHFLFNLLNNMPGFSYRCLWDEQWTMLFVSEGFAKVTGHSPSRVIQNSKYTFADLIVDQDKPLVEKHVSDAVQSGQSFNISYRIKTKKGRIRWVTEQGNCIFNEKKEPLYLEGYIFDITESKYLEEKYARAKRYDYLVGLAGSIAHDLNNVLSPITMATELLEPNGEDTLHDKLVETIQASANRGADIVKRLMIFARGQETNITSVRVKDILGELQGMITTTFPSSIETRFLINNATDLLVVDPTQLHQALLNLCINAKHAMPDGGVLEVRSETREIASPIKSKTGRKIPSGRYIIISVEDTGTGIPTSLQRKVFEPFFSTKSPEDGTGLGLASVVEAVNNLNGFVDLTSKLGTGTTFHLYFQADKHAVSANSANPLTQVPKGRGQWILVVDDESSLLLMMKSFLQSCEYSVLTANNGPEAIALLEKYKDKVEVGLIDWHMENLPPGAVYRALHLIAPEVEWISISGSIDAAEKEETYHEGIHHFLPKPFNFRQLMDILDKMLNKS